MIYVGWFRLATCIVYLQSLTLRLKSCFGFGKQSEHFLVVVVLFTPNVENAIDELRRRTLDRGMQINGKDNEELQEARE